MSILVWTWIAVGASFVLYIGIALWTKAKSTAAFYTAEQSISPILNGMAIGSDWLSAASFISMAGMISFMGCDGAMYLMGWTGGYVLLALLLAPYLRKYGKFTVPQFIGDRYYSQGARVISLLCAIFISFTYVAGQMRGVGIVFARFLELDINTGVVVGMALVFTYSTMGGMKGITYTQVAQYCVLIIAYLIPAIFISFQLTGNPVPQLGYGSSISAAGAQLLGDASSQGRYLLDVLDGLQKDLGFAAYSTGVRPKLDVLFITFALMAGTAGMPHVLMRFFTVPRIRDARSSAGYALICIAILYTTAPAVAAFARTNLIKTLHNVEYANAPSWFKNWEKTGLVGWKDKNGDGSMQYAPGEFAASLRESANELRFDNDIIVLASPEIARLPHWVVALVVAGGLAAALSTAAGLLLVIAAAVSHDLLKSCLTPNITETQELLAARLASGGSVIIAGLFGIYPPGFVAQVVAFAFGLAAASFFPAIVMGIFSRKINGYGAISGMIVGIVFTAGYIIWFKLMNPASYNVPANWWFGISPEGIGTLGMILNFAIMWIVSKLTPEPPQEIQKLVESLRYPGRNVPKAQSH